MFSYCDIYIYIHVYCSHIQEKGQNYEIQKYFIAEKKKIHQNFF